MARISLSHPLAVPGRHSFAAELSYVFFMLGVTTVATAIAIWLAVAEGLELFFVVLTVVYLAITTFGVTGGLHRYFSHKSFRCKRWLEIVLALLGTLAGQDFFIRWIYVHRVHHRYTDQPGDPHSPWYDGEKRLGVVRGLIHAHNGWLFRPEPAVVPSVVPDLLRDPVLVAIDRLSPLITLAGVILPGLIALLYEPSLHAFMLGVLWAGFVRLFIMYHVSWGVNSFGHRFGGKVPDQTHNARNNPLLGILTFGDGWHANHHEFAASARHGFGAQLDITYLILCAMAKLGWVWDLRLPPEQAVQSWRQPKAASASR